MVHAFEGEINADARRGNQIVHPCAKTKGNG